MTRLVKNMIRERTRSTNVANEYLSLFWMFLKCLITCQQKYSITKRRKMSAAQSIARKINTSTRDLYGISPEDI